ncbi:MAG: 50S ribosomal protein L9, partial [Acidobacteriales bacterium]
AEPIKLIGQYKVAIKLHHDVSAEVEVNVVREEEE